MLTIRLRWLGGQYHATPWGRHVNEGDVEWPPAPWRLVRAILAAGARAGMPLEERAPLVRALAHLSSRMPRYRLPEAALAHTCHYMPDYRGGTNLVFDAFAALPKEAEVFVGWPEVELEEEERQALASALGSLAYLGRAESWVEATLSEASPADWNCYPDGDPGFTQTGEYEQVRLLAPLPPEDYASWRSKQKRMGKNAKRAAPEPWWQALMVETADVQKGGWNLPPAARWVRYWRKLDALEPRPKAVPATRLQAQVAVFVLQGKPLPSVLRTVRIAEGLRSRVLRCFGKEDGRFLAPAELTGHGEKTGKHEHAFYLPLDEDADGFIDRVAIYIPAGMDGEHWQKVLALNGKQFHGAGEGDWRLLLEAFGDPARSLRAFARAREWVSVTPYLHPWHRKKNFGVLEQIQRECALRGLPELIAAEPLREIRLQHGQGRPLRASAFLKVRRKRGLVQPDRHGSFWRLRFAEPVQGPLALGFGCHFGLGLFMPADGSPAA